MKGCILLVDDEELVLEVGLKMLERIGYKAIGAGTSAEAVETFQREGDNIDLVLLDVNLPDAQGADTFNRLRAINPDAQVLLATGHTETDEILELMKLGCRGRLQKPYTLERLSEEISGALC